MFAEQLDQSIVFGVAPDPIPNETVVFHHGDGAIVETDAGRVHIVRPSELLKMQTGMRPIGEEQPKSAPGILLNFNRQF
jgi:fructose-1,6-bisphosphatase/inositol monophosphatase family enzyme